MCKPRWPASILAIAPLLVLWGCGYIAEPLPPLMNIPARGENLTALQRGSSIIVHFTVPALTTEGVVIKQRVRMDLRIGPPPPGAFNADAWAAGAQAVTGGTTANGIAEYIIPAAGWTGKQVAIAVKIIGSNARDAGWSVPVRLTVMAPPPQPQDLKAESAPQGVRLAWQGAGTSFAILRRGPGEKDYQVLARSSKPEYVDSTAQFRKPYSYIVQSLVKAGDGEAQSDLSNPVDITPMDIFPAAPPVGLTAVPSIASIELVWERSTEPDIIGYRVYRAVGNGAFELLADRQALPAYSDRKIESGKTYRYAVSVMKNNNVESKMSVPVEVAAP